MPPITTEPITLLAQQWQDAGVHPGDTLLLHSDILWTVTQYRRQGLRLTPQNILDSFLQALGPQGTLLSPLFNFDFTTGTPFNIRHTPSQMGALTEAARQHPQAVRTGHPIYSFAVIGAQASQFAPIDNQSAYGSESPFALLHQLNGKIASLNLAEDHSMTFYHHVEEMNAVDYRYHKNFRGGYTDAQGHSTLRTYSLYVRDIERGVHTHIEPTAQELWQAGHYQGHPPYQASGLRTISANILYDFITDTIQSGRAHGKLYRIAS